MDSLPRDMQLEIIKRFDMDTRIKCGIIGRLRVPTHFLESKLKPPVMSWRQVPRSDPPLYVHKAVIQLSSIYKIVYEGLHSKNHTFDIWSIIDKGLLFFVNTKM